MRYRPFGISGKAVSAISLRLRETAALPTTADWRAFLYAAMESGVNCFDMQAGSQVMCAGMQAALQAVERRLLFLSWRICGAPGKPLTAQAISQSVRAGLHFTHCAYFDLLMLDPQAFANLTADAVKFLDDLRSNGLALQIGVIGHGPVVDAAIKDPLFEVVGAPFNLTSGWEIRRRLKEAQAANMALIATDIFPLTLIKPPPPSSAIHRSLLFRRQTEPLAGTGTYAFLHETPAWSASEICLAFALTEPGFSTVQVEASRPEVVAKMSAVADRDLPTGVAAQIEMARFSAQAQEVEAAEQSA